MWCMNMILCDYESVWPEVWPQNKCWSLWPIFHGPVIFPLILKTDWCMKIITGDYESVWPDIWPKNKCFSSFTITFISWSSDFALYLPYIWWMSVIFSDNEAVWPKVWPQIKYRSTWPIFYGLVILLNNFKIIWWMNITVGIMNQCGTENDLIKYM